MTQQHRGHRVTQKEIAAAIGVSQATVSLVLNGQDRELGVAPETRERVLAALREHGYVANPAARSLRGRSNRILGLYTFEPVFPTDQRGFYYPFLLGVEEEAAELGYDLLLFSSAGNGASRSIYAGGTNRLLKADACVLLGRHLSREELGRLALEDFPFVFIGRRDVPGATVPYVSADYASATAALVEGLIVAGHRDIALVKDADSTEPSVDREAGYVRAMTAAGLAARVRTMTFSASDHLSAERLAALVGDGVTALAVEPNDEADLPAHVERVAGEVGLTIPGDLSVVVLGEAGSRSDGSRWTSFSLPREDMGRTAVRLLVDLIDGQDVTPQPRVLECSLVSGGTTSAPADHRLAAGGDR